MVNTAEEFRELDHVTRHNDPCQQLRLPILMRFRNPGHRNDVVDSVLKDQAGHGIRRDEALQPLHTERLTMDPVRMAVPFHGHAEFRERLFEHPDFTRGSLHANRAIGNSSRENTKRRDLVRLDESAGPEPVEERARIFDIEWCHDKPVLGGWRMR